jgi:hypothetical protein
MKLKRYFKQAAILAVFVLGASSFLTGCEKVDSKEAFGVTNIFIPQSTQSGNVNLNYLVPSGLDTNTYNFKIDTKTNKVNVYLGVNRAGKATPEAYTVNIVTRPDTINQLIANGLIKVNPNPTKTVVLLPASAYTLPATVAVPEGQYMQSFNLAIDLPALKTYAGKKVALCVALAGPTKYALSSTNAKVVIIIDVDALKLP